jgi:hypothetical protein
MDRLRRKAGLVNSNTYSKSKETIFFSEPMFLMSSHNSLSDQYVYFYRGTLEVSAILNLLHTK